MGWKEKIHLVRIPGGSYYEKSRFINTWNPITVLRYECVRGGNKYKLEITDNSHFLMNEKKFENENYELRYRLLRNLKELQTSVEISGKLEKKVAEMESSKFWKAKLFYNKIRRLLGPSNPSGEKRSWVEQKVRKFSWKILKKIRKILKIIFRNLYLFLEEKPVEIVLPVPAPPSPPPPPPEPEPEKETNAFNEIIWAHRIREDLSSYERKPLISIILPVYKTPLSFLKEAIDSVIAQYYTHWELCIADDFSEDMGIKELLEEYKERDQRIKVVYRKENGHISACSNSAIELATGEYLALLDHDDVLTADALYEVVRKINLFPSAEFIYSDEDKLQPDGSFTDAYHKPDWCPDSFLSRNYITHFSIIRTSLVRQVGGFRKGYEGSQDYDLFLRVTELTDQIVHIPKILYHWRVHPNSTAFAMDSKDYASDASLRALQDSVLRRKERASVDAIQNAPGYFRLTYTPKTSGKVSIIIPTKDKSEILKVCLMTLFSTTNYENYEVIVVSNGSTEKELFSMLEEYQQRYGEKFRYYENNTPFNYSHLMNYAVAKSTGELLLFLNNDTEIIHEDWLGQMVGQAERQSIGVVGCKLLYPNNTIQHAGVVIGLGGAAGHVFVGEQRDALGYFCQLITINNYSALTGACIMCRRTVFEEVGGYDENFKVEFNDIDFCLRIKERGYHNVYLPQVEVYHHESLTRGNPMQTQESREQNFKERTLFMDRWQKYVDHDPCFNVHFDKYRANYQLLN